MESKEYRILNCDKYLSYNQLKKAMIHNAETLIMLEKEVKRLRELNMKNTTVEEHKEEKQIILTINEEDTEENNILDEINYYLSLVNKIDFNEKENLNERIMMSLPSIKNGNFQTIIYGINAEILKNINEIKRFIEEEKESFTKEDLQEFRNDILENQRKIMLINQAINCSLNYENKTIKEETPNKIVFLNTTSGNVYALKDIKSIDKEYFERFNGLFNSIEDGTFKNIKYLDSNNPNVAGVTEVRDFKTRIVFDRINSKTYAIIAVFIKKSDNDTGYLDFLERRVATYREQKESIISKIKNIDYMLEQQEILKQIYEKIRPKELSDIAEKGCK